MRLTIDGNAWNRGFWDGELGLPLRCCPYAVGSTERWSWSSGYIEGNAFRKGFKATLPCSPMRPRKDAPGAETDAVPLRVTPSVSAPEEALETGVNVVRRSGVSVRRRLTMGAKPDQLSADSGFCSEPNLAGLEARGIDGYIATGRAKHAVGGTAESETLVATVDAGDAASTCPEQSTQEPAEPPTRVEAMREKIRAGGHASPYRLRKQLPEPVFGQIKQARGFRQFLLRGLENVAAEWAIVCTAHNLLKLAKGWSLSAARPIADRAPVAA